MSSKKFWKRVDYVWLTLATVGLFAAFGAIRRNDAEESLRRVTHSLETTLLTILDEKSKMSIQYPGQLPACELPIGMFNASGCPFVYNIVREVERTKGSIDWPIVATPTLAEWIEMGQIAERSAPFDPRVTSAVGAINTALKRAEGLTLEALPLRQRSVRDPLEDMAFRLWPTILIVALSIRVTKVSAEVFLEKS